MKFKTKPIEIEAWREGCGEPMPGWVKCADLKYGGSTGIKLAPRETDWYIYNGDDDIYTFDEETFARKYERVEG